MKLTDEDQELVDNYIREHEEERIKKGNKDKEPCYVIRLFRYDTYQTDTVIAHLVNSVWEMGVFTEEEMRIKVKSVLKNRIKNVVN